MHIYTIGFTQKTARQFFTLLKNNQVDILIDIRLNPNSQLAGFTKQENLPYLLEKLIQCEYRYEPGFAPTKELLTAFRKDKDWGAYEDRYLRLLKERNIPQTLDKSLYQNHHCCLLCSEPIADSCHRRLAAEHIKQSWENVTIKHL